MDMSKLSNEELVDQFQRKTSLVKDAERSFTIPTETYGRLLNERQLLREEILRRLNAKE